ncbi:hypothetical protein, partial [Gordonia sp. UBA7860]
TAPKVLKADTGRMLQTMAKGSGKQQVATTMALVRVFKDLLRDKEIGKRIVP